MSVPEIIIALNAITLAFCGLMLFRNRLVCRIRGRRINEVYAAAQKSFDEGSLTKWRDFYDEFEAGPSYDRMECDFRRWTYKAFYPYPVGEQP